MGLRTKKRYRHMFQALCYNGLVHPFRCDKALKQVKIFGLFDTVNAKRPPEAAAGPGVEKLPHELSLLLARNLVAARKAASMSQRELAQKATVARDHLIRIERGEANVGLGVLMNLARAVGVEPHELINPHQKSSP